VAAPEGLQWVFTECPIYYITLCTYNRRRILDIQFAVRAREYGVCVGRYVIMPDHIHLFAGFGLESIPVSMWVKSLKNTISKTLTNATFYAPHWQKGFFDHVLRSRQSYEEKWIYVRENPVRARLVRTAEEWPYAGEISELSL
jgi:REP element-mobilizing transposase RayT